ncbi:MAG TPA: hypothetical protein VK116_12190, partial [Planctomycetota bacterium]|nr:hypothetical protein [Planctomycetota bacterium]
ESHDLFASIPIRPIEAEVLARSVLRATGLEEPQPERNAQRVRRYIDQAKAEFVRRFGVDETERRDEFQGTVLQVLLLFNGEYTEGAAPADRTFQTSYERVAPGSLGVVLHGVRPDQRIDRLFLATLSRRPTSHERLALEQHVASARTEEEWERALRHIQWALLNSAEFLHTP